MPQRTAACLRPPVAAVGLAAVLCVLLVVVPASPAAAARAALGDSYASGEGAGAYEAAAGACHRTPRAWPRLLGVAADQHFACSGATTADVLGRPSAPEAPPQIGSLERGARPALLDTVFVTVGGNDLRFSSKVVACRFGLVPCLRDRAAFEAELTRVRPRLVDTYRRIRITSLAPRVVAVGYPDIAPAGDERDRCFWLSAAERRNVAAFAARLDATLASAAREAGVLFVSVRDALDGHELCTRRSWMVGIARPGRNWLSDAEQGHPNRRGQQAIAEMVRLRLGS